MATLTWIAGTSGLWTAAANWSPAQVPATGDTALVNQPGAYLISLTGTQAVGSLTLDDASGQVSVAGSLTANTVTVSAGSIAVGGYLAGALTNAGSASVSGTADLSGLVNTGTLLNTGLLELSGTVASSSLSRIGGSGNLQATGTVMNAGATLDGTTFGQQFIVNLGTIQGGTVTNLTTLGPATLDGVTWEGTLALRYNAPLTVLDGLTLTGTAGSGPGTLLLTTFVSESPGTVDFVGSQTLDNAIVQGAGSLIADSGTLTIGSAATLSSSFIATSNDLGTGFTFAGTGTVVNDGTIISYSQQGSPSLLNDGAIAVTNSDFENYGTLDARDITIPGSNIPNAIASYVPGINIISINATTFDNHAGGVIEMGQSIGTASMTVSASTVFTNDGILSTDDGAASSIAGGTIDLQALVAGSGTIELNGGGTAEIGGAVANSQTIDFAGAGTLMLDQPSFVGAAIAGFASSDLIQLGVSAAPISYSSGDLKLSTAGGTIDLGITGTHSLSDFIINTQSASTSIQLSCFATGTRLATTRGPVPVEQLREGDLMLLANRDDPLPVVWIGHRALDCRSQPNPHRVWPVRIAAGAFAPNVPARDLWLSPNHAVFVQGVLTPVKCLVNGSTIAQQPRDRIQYWHVELPEHAVLLAEGLSVESLLPDSERSGFSNGAGPVALYPDYLALQWEAGGCAELVVDGPALDEIRNRLQRRADRLRRDSDSRRRSAHGARHAA